MSFNICRNCCYRSKGKASYSSGISFISGGLKKTAEQEAADIKAGPSGSGAQGADDQGPDVDPLLQEQFGKPKSSKSRQRKGFKNLEHPGKKG